MRIVPGLCILNARWHEGLQCRARRLGVRRVFEMSMTSITQTGGSTADLGAADAEMDQIRELLVGEQQRHTRARMDRLEARMKELEEDIARRFDALAARIETLGQETAAGRRASFEELSRSVMELGERVRNLSQS